MDASIESDFNRLGGTSTYYPYSKTTPVIGGVSKSSAYYKLVRRYSGFVSMGGGSSILCSSFGKPVVIYVNTSSDIRPGYFDENSYFRKFGLKFSCFSNSLPTL